MKYTLRIIAFLLLFSAVAAVCICCSKPGRGADGTTEQSDETTNKNNDPGEIIAPDDPKEEELMYNDIEIRSSYTISTPSTKLTLSLEDGKLFVSGLSNPSSKYEWCSSPTEVPFPSRIEKNKASDSEKMSWKLQSVGENNDPENGYSLKFTYKNESPAFVLESVWNARGDDGPVQHTMYVYNNAGGTYIIYSPQSFSLGIKSELEPTVWRFHKESFTADSKGVYTDVLSGTKSVVAETTTVVDTSNNSKFIPCIVVDASEKHGIYLCWEWPHGRVKADIKNGDASITAGVNDDFKTAIPDGGKFLIPTAYIGAYEGDVDEGTNIMKHWFLWEKAPDKLTQDSAEPLTQMDDQLSCTQHDLLAMGIQSAKWDYGWWGDESPVEGMYFKKGEGTWQLRNKTFKQHIRTYRCKSLAEYGELLKSKGINWTVYILLHDSKEDIEGALTSVGKNGHPEWFSTRVASLTESADLGNEECVQFIKENIYKFIVGNNVGTWRTDMEPMPWSSNNRNRHVFGDIDTPYWNAVGFYEILDYLYGTIPGFRLENCGSGGAYKDYATMSRSMVVQTEDRASYANIRQTFYASSYALPPSQLMGLCACGTFAGCDVVSTAVDNDFGLRSIIMGLPVASNGGPISGHWNDDFEEAVTKYFNMYNTYIKPLQKNGNLYHILPRPDNVHWDGIEYFDKNSETGERMGVVFLFKPTNTEGDVKNVVLKGLDRNAKYRLDFEDRPEQNCVMTGNELMTAGIDVKIAGSFGSEMIWISLYK